jgi:hypothetical protein
VLSSRGYPFSEEQGLDSPKNSDDGYRSSDKAKEPKTDGLREVAKAPMRWFPESRRLHPESIGLCPEPRERKPTSCEARSKDG